MNWLRSKVNRGRDIGQRGFTLIELMIALLALSILLTAIYRVFASQERLFRNQEQISALQENLRSSVEYINQELTWMGYQVPGLSVVRAADSEIIFKANIPNSGTTIQYVRYTFDPSTDTISRAAGPTTTDVETADLTVMANDIAGLSFSYINVFNGVLTTDPALVAGELGGSDDSSLLMIQRVKARVTARTSRPDHFYTHPATASTTTPWGGGQYRTRSAVLDLKARNAEDVTLQGGQVGLGACGWLDSYTLTTPGGSYTACPDKRTALTLGTAAIDFSDNPYVTITAFDKDGNINTNPTRVTYVFASSDSDQSPYDFFDSADSSVQDNVIDSGETLYMAAANTVTNVSGGGTVSVQFAYNDGVCTQQVYTPSNKVLIASGVASHLNTLTPYRSATSMAMELGYEKISDGSPLSLPEPVQIPLCSSVEDVGIRFTAQAVDDCYNGIAGETVSWDDAGNGGTLTDTDNGDGTYSMLYEPPASIGTVSPTFSIPITVTWGAESYSHNLTLGPGAAYDIIIDNISEPLPSTFNFSASVAGAAAQRSTDQASSFSIDRVDGKPVVVSFHLEDQCGNWIFSEVPNLSVSTTSGTVIGLSEASGTYSFTWKSDAGCGGAVPGQTITIASTTITDAVKKTEDIAFSLNQTRSGPDAGPWVDLTADPDSILAAGDTADNALVYASLMKYSTTQERCSNIPGAFSMDLELNGVSGTRAGSFSNSSPFDETTKTVVTDAGTGVATFRVYSGMAQWNDTFSLTAIANVDGGTYSQSTGFTMKPSDPGASSGLYADNLFGTRVGFTEPKRGYDPGDTIYVQIFDFDENEDPTAVDSQLGPEYVEVVLSSLRTGDSETVRLTETNPNTALFKTSLLSAFSGTANPGDGVLQVLYGDEITAYYQDRNDAAENDSWQAYTSGPQSLLVYKYHSAGATSLITGSGLAQTPSLKYGDKVQPVLYLPIRENDGVSGSDTTVLQLVSGSGDDSDTLIMREQADTGLFLPDDTVYSGPFFTIIQTDPGDAANLLYAPTSPRFLTLTYDDPGVTVEQTSLFVQDSDPPTVSITVPVASATVGSDVTVTVAVDDVDNFTTDAGISRIDLMVNGIVLTTITGADLSPSQDLTWSTKVFISPQWQPLWLDGNHTLSARAWDNALNSAVSTGVDVTLNNNLRAIEFAYPGFSDIFSGTVTVGVQVSPLDPSFALSDVYFSANGTNHNLTNLGGGLYEYDLDTTAEPEGAAVLIAYVKDEFGNISQSAQLDIQVDRTPPNYNLGVAPPWVTVTDFPLTHDVMITDANSLNSVDPASVTHTYTGACSSPLDMPYMSASGNTYSFFWDGTTGTPCYNLGTGAGVEGTITWTVKAADMASPANTISRSLTTNIDTIKPVMSGTISVSPLYGSAFTLDIGLGTAPVAGFVKQDTVLGATVTDTWPWVGAFAFGYFQDPGALWAGTAPGSAITTGAIDATSGAFSYSWTTTGTFDTVNPWPAGVYYIRGDALDVAQNVSDNSAPAEAWVYVDNNAPTVGATLPMPGSNPGFPDARNTIDLMYSIDPNYGFLKGVLMEIWSVDTASIVDSLTVFKPLAARARYSQGFVPWDTLPFADGNYEVRTYASDHADNIAAGAPYSFRVDNTYLINEGYMFAPACTPWAGTPLYSLDDLHGAIIAGTSPAAGESVMVEISSGALFYSYHDVTDASGKFAVAVPAGPCPPAVGPADSHLFADGDFVDIRVYRQKDGVNSQKAYISGQVPGAPFPLSVDAGNRYTAHHKNITFSHSAAPDPYQVNFTGLLSSPSGPAAGVTVRWLILNPCDTVNMDDPLYDFGSSTCFTEDVTAPDGSFTLTIPAWNPDGLYDGTGLTSDVYYYEGGVQYTLGFLDGAAPRLSEFTANSWR